MITFGISLIALILGYLFYGKYVEKVFGPSTEPTPAVRKNDGIDYVVLPTWKVFMIQFLNIAGTGPIFGAIMGAWYGPWAYLWIVFGCIFAGATHDYLSGMLSLRKDGVGLPELVGAYLGRTARNIMLVFAVMLLLMVGAVFVYSPAIILSGMLGNKLFWIIAIFIYYSIATMLPIDKIIGKLYPLFAISLLFMAAALFVGLIVKMPNLPELWTDLSSYQGQGDMSLLGRESFVSGSPIFPCMFITIACGAISGFHATQSPLMARCLSSEKYGRPIFYGAMITEGVVALIWATVSMFFFYYGGWREVVTPETVQAFTDQAASGKSLIQYFDAPTVVKLVCDNWLGVVGGVLALLGVVAAPITSGDTAFRSCRLIIADFLHLDQKGIAKRLMVSLPLFAVAITMLVWQIENPEGFNVIWQYFGWSNQTMSVFTLWTLTVYLAMSKKNYWIMLVPALFMTVICSTFLLISKQAFHLSPAISYTAGFAVFVVAVVWFVVWFANYKRKTNTNN